MIRGIYSVLVIGILVFLRIPVSAQIVGFWEITEVMVGDQRMTPIAKWTKINKDSTYQSGNGWLQNAEGTWTFNHKNGQFLPMERHGMVDDFGPFEVKFNEDLMSWERFEEGEKVVVTLKPIKKLPLGPADKISGLWDFKSAFKGNENLTSSLDPDTKRYFLIRWDRIFIDDLGPNGRQTGYWHMNGHRPLLSLINHNKSKPIENWEVHFSTSEMVWMGVSETNQGLKLTFEHLNKFPGD